MADPNRPYSRRQDISVVPGIENDEQAVQLHSLRTPSYHSNPSEGVPSSPRLAWQSIRRGLATDQESASSCYEEDVLERRSGSSYVEYDGLTVHPGSNFSTDVDQRSEVEPDGDGTNESDQQRRSYYEGDDRMDIYAGDDYRETLRPEDGLARELENDDSQSNVDDSMSSAQRNSLLGQSFFAEEEAQEEERLRVLQLEREVSMKLRQYGDTFSATQSVPTEMLSNGGLQSSSSPRLPSSALRVGGYASPSDPTGGFQSSSSTRLSSNALLAGSQASAMDLGNGGFQSSSSRLTVPDHQQPGVHSNKCKGAAVVRQQSDENSTTGNGGFQSSSSQTMPDQLKAGSRSERSKRCSGSLWMGQRSNEKLAARVSTKGSKTRGSNGPSNLPRSQRIASHMSEMNVAEMKDDDDEWEDVKERRGRRRGHSGNSTANRSDDSQTSSLRTRYDSSNNILLPPDYTRKAPRPESVIRTTNAFLEEEFLRKERLIARRRRIVQERKANTNPFSSTPPTITAQCASSSSRATGPYRKLPSTVGRRTRRSRRYPPVSSHRYARGTRQHPSCAGQMSSLDSVHHLKETAPMVPTRVGRPRCKQRKVIRRSKPTMVSLLGPNPRIEGVYDDPFYFESPPPAPQEEISMEIYTPEEMQDLQDLVDGQEESRQVRVLPYIYVGPMPITSRQIKDDAEQIKLSRYVLLFCACTFVLLPFYGAGHLDFLMDRISHRRIQRFTEDSRRLAWLVLIGEVLAIIIAVIVTIIVVVGVKKT